MLDTLDFSRIKVVMDTGFLVDTQKKLESTNSKPVFVGPFSKSLAICESQTWEKKLIANLITEILEFETDYKTIFEAPKGTQLYKLFNRKIQKPDAFYLLRRSSLFEARLKLLKLSTRDYFFFMSRFPLVYALNLSTSFLSRIFFNRNIYYETLNVIYVRKNLEEGMKRKLLRE